MKKLNAKEVSFDFSTNQIMVKFDNGKSQQLDSVNSGLSSEQKQKLANELKSRKEPITFSQIQGQLDKGGSKDKGGNVGIIAAIVVVGVVLAVIVGVAVYKSRKRND